MKGYKTERKKRKQNINHWDYELVTQTGEEGSVGETGHVVAELTVQARILG